MFLCYNFLEMKPALIATVMLAIAVGFAPRSEAEQSAAKVAQTSQQQNPSSATPPVSNERTTANNQNSQAQPPHGDTTLQWVLVGVGIVTAIFVGWQAYETRKAAQATQSSVGHIERQAEIMDGQLSAMKEQRELMERQLKEMGRQTYVTWQQIKMTLAKEMARLAVDLRTEGFSLDSLQIGSQVCLRVTHYGFTNAFNVLGEGDIVIRKSRNFPEGVSNNLIELPSVIKPEDGHINTSLTVFPSLSHAPIELVKDEAAFLHLVGTIKYQDFLNNSHTVPFWYTWKVVCKSPADGVPLMDFSYWESRIHPELQRQIEEIEQQKPEWPNPN